MKGITTAEQAKIDYIEKLRNVFLYLRNIWGFKDLTEETKQLLSEDVLSHYKIDVVDPNTDDSILDELFDLMKSNPKLDQFIELMMREPDPDYTNTDQFDQTDDIYDNYKNSLL